MGGVGEEIIAVGGVGGMWNVGICWEINLITDIFWESMGEKWFYAEGMNCRQGRVVARVFRPALINHTSVLNL